MSKKKKSQEQHIKELIAHIMKVLVGAVSLMRGIGLKENLFTLRECLELIKHDKNLNNALINNIGISATDYIKLLDTDAMPELSMNHLSLILNQNLSHRIGVFHR